MGQQTPAYAVSQTSVLRFPAVSFVRADGKLMEGGNPEHRPQHLRPRGIADDFAIQKRRRKFSQVACAGGHRSRTARWKALGLRSKLFVKIISVGHVGCEILAIDEARARHPQRGKDRLL